MNGFFIKYTKRFFNSAFILVFVSYILLYCSFIIPFTYAYWFKLPYDNKEYNCNFYFLACISIIYFIIPTLITKFLYKRSLAEVGIAFPKKMGEAYLFGILILVILLPGIIYFSGLPKFQHYYWLGQPSIYKWLFFALFAGPAYYTFEEYFFRGFLLFNLWEKVGWHGYWITDLMFALAHFSKPDLEILYALPTGILLAFLALRTRSIWPGVIVHYCMGIAMLLGTNHIF